MLAEAGGVATTWLARASMIQVGRDLVAEPHRIGQRDYFPTPERTEPPDAVREIAETRRERA